jgi:putative transposase
MNYNPQIHHRRSTRLDGYDYSRAGVYFITICTKGMTCLFGDISNGEMALNETGKVAYNEWVKTPDLRPNVLLDVFVIMPNHMHGIILIDETVLSKPETAVAGFRSPSNNVGAIVRGYKSAVTRQINLLNNDVSIWQRNYYEHIIRSERSYQHISGYIVDNPANRNADKFRHP